jgi:hypothetical protein
MKRNAGVIMVLILMCSPLRAGIKDLGVDLGVDRVSRIFCGRLCKGFIPL